MSDDGSGSSAPSSGGDAVHSPLHAQAVRFLTSLRHHSPDASIQAQQEFLKSKGLDDLAIQAAFHDAKRPEGLEVDPANAPVLPGTKPVNAAPPALDRDLSDEAAFDLAKQAFDDPIHSPPPPALPSRNYPRSPLALYYQEAQDRAAAENGIGGNSSAALTRRYAVLLAFFRSLSYFATLGGALTTIAVLLYRSFVMPKWINTLNCRSYLLKHHHSLWDNVVGSVRALKSAGLAPPDKVKRIIVQSDEEDAAEQRKESQEEKKSTVNGKAASKRVQFADEVDGGGQLEQREGEEESAKSRKITEMDGPTADKKEVDAAAEHDETKPLLPSDKAEGDASNEDDHTDRIELEPIDLCEPIRQSLAALRGLLGNEQPSVASRTTSDPSRRAATVSDAASDEESSGSDSWQDDDGSEAASSEDEDEVEFDPFIEVNGKSGDYKKSKKANRKNGVGGKKATKNSLSGSTSRKHSPSTSSGLPFAPHVAPLGFALSSNTGNSSSSETSTAALSAETAASSKSLYTTLADFNAAITARSLAARSSTSFRLGGNNAAPYGSFAFNSSAATTSSNGASATADGSAPSATSNEDKARETAAQIRAEIRSFKGLLLSRRNFPRHGYGPTTMPTTTTTTGSTSTTAA